MKASCNFMMYSCCNICINLQCHTMEVFCKFLHEVVISVPKHIPLNQLSYSIFIAFMFWSKFFLVQCTMSEQLLFCTALPCVENKICAYIKLIPKFRITVYWTSWLNIFIYFRSHFPKLIMKYNLNMIMILYFSL